MSSVLRNKLASLWTRPDPVLAGAGAAGELFIARIRLLLAGVLLLIPLANLFLLRGNHTEEIIGLGLTCGVVLLSSCAYLLARRGLNSSWLSFATSFFDVSLVSAMLAVFLLLHEPHTAVNSKVVFEGYFLAIAGTGLRYDVRVCVTAGLLAIAEYFSIVFIAANHWDLNSQIYSPYPYGMFSWSAQISRMIIMLTGSVLTIAIVGRSQKLLRLATTDPLTGLFNRRYVDDRFAIELSRAQRHNEPLTIALIDADRFKSFNDTHGHAAGDAALRSVGAILRQSFRLSDTVGRFGGEEFVVIMPQTDLQAAQHKLESLRALIAGSPMRLPSSDRFVEITISAGAASFPQDCSSEAELLATADERLFQAKREGRNRVVTDSPVPVSQN